MPNLNPVPDSSSLLSPRTEEYKEEGVKGTDTVQLTCDITEALTDIAVASKGEYMPVHSVIAKLQSAMYNTTFNSYRFLA